MEFNNSIKCSVQQCKNYSKSHCKLSQVEIGTHEQNPTMVECTDCKCFALK